MRSHLPRPRSPRRGATLVEMLVAVALLVLMMTIIVQIFSAATGAVSTARTYQELDSSLRQLDATLRQDLLGATARFTPPLNPNDNLGYFEYDENEFADLQGEDTDDILRFTAKSPPGQPFTGRLWVIPNQTTGTGISQQIQPIMITSQFAEVIYFLRNGNLYRRVLLIAPERQASIASPPLLPPPYPQGTFPEGVSWLGVNDLSARPAPTGDGSKGTIILNTLGDLTNRENRFAYPRFATDYVQHTKLTDVTAPDGLPDDENPKTFAVSYSGDGVPDYWPTLYLNVFNAPTPASPQRVWEATLARRVIRSDTMAFPFIFPGAFSVSDSYSASNGLGLIHTPIPSTMAPTLASLQSINHAPLDTGDSLPFLSTRETWWGLPTWRETLSTNWTDPYHQLYNPPTGPPSQPNGLSPFLPNDPIPQADPNLLPKMTTDSIPNTNHPIPYRLTAQTNTDGAGSATFTFPFKVWDLSWEDDLIMTGVRTFDVKAYDNAYSGYVDLGWGDDLRLYVPYNVSAMNLVAPTTVPLAVNGFFLDGTPPVFQWPPALRGVAAAHAVPNVYDRSSVIEQTFAHEGRMPPRIADFRFDAQFPNGGPFSSAPGYTPNIGDDSNTVIRLRRVWDTWSTTYTRAPATGYDPNTGFPHGPPFSPPIYTSYPPPYPAPLRGIQIQIRVVDPRNELIKTLTIRQDFTDKL